MLAGTRTVYERKEKIVSTSMRARCRGLIGSIGEMLVSQGMPTWACVGNLSLVID